MLYKCIFLCFLFIIMRYGDDSKRYVVATKNPDRHVADRD